MSQLNRAWRGITKLSTRHLPDAMLLGRALTLETRVLGDGDGAWRIPATLPRKPLCYCVGVGRETAFDEALVREYGAEVHCFDPTPTSVEYMETRPELPLQFHAMGIWNQDTEMTLFRQDPTDDVNLSIIDPGASRGGAVTRAPFRRLVTVMKQLGHQTIDLLKLDVEGAWQEILDDMLDSDIVPGVLCVEFDSPVSPLSVSRMARRLKRVGLHYVARERDDYLFVVKAPTPKSK